jgi:hypothetical protein
MRKHLLTVVVALSCAGTLAAQAPVGREQETPSPPRSTPQAAPIADQRNPSVTMVGCLYNERDRNPAASGHAESRLSGSR